MGTKQAVDLAEQAKERRRIRSANRARRRRAMIAGNTDVLDQFEPQVGNEATTDQVKLLLGIGSTTLYNLQTRHGDELAAAGYSATAQTWTRRAIITAAQMVRARTSPKAGQIAEAAGARYTVLSFSGADRLNHLRRMQSLISKAFEFGERVKEDDPAEVWVELSKLDRYTLQGLVVAMGAMVPLEQPGLMRWLTTLPPEPPKRHETGNSGAASGLALLVPTRESSDGVPASQVAV